MFAIPAFDLTKQHRALSREINAALDRVFESGLFILGEEVETFEKEAAAFVGTLEAVSCASGTDSLHLALRAAGIGAGDEVVVSAFSFIATAETVLHAGAIPVFSDIDPETFTLDPESVEAALSPKTRAIIAVHLYGHPSDISSLSTIAEQHNLVLIEDCAQAFGAHRNHRCAGAMAHAGCHSFFPTKNLGACGDGGMITTDDENLAKRIRLLRNHGTFDGSSHEVIGFNSRLDEIQAAILRVKLRRIKTFNDKRQQIADVYTATLGEQVQTPVCAAQCVHVFNQYTILSKRRDKISAALAEMQIGTRIYYPLALPDQPSLSGLGRSVSCDRARRTARECLSLPMFPELSAHDAERIATAVNASA